MCSNLFIIGGTGSCETLSVDTVKHIWRKTKPPPENMTSYHGKAVVHYNIAYFSYDYNVYSYQIPEHKWDKLPQLKYSKFGLAIVNHILTSIGGSSMVGSYGGWFDKAAKPTAKPTNSLLSLVVNSWREILPPMPTKRMNPVAANTPTHLVVAGGITELLESALATVEVLNTGTLQWSTARSFPQPVPQPNMTTCGENLYVANNNKIFYCSVDELIKSSTATVWTRLADIPVPTGSSLATLRGCVLAIGGKDPMCGNNPVGTVFCYNMATNSWSVIGEMPTPRYDSLTAVLSGNELMVVGGGGFKGCCTEIAQIN